MAFGPGKYDDVATHVREVTAAEGAVVLVIKGLKGSGFSAQLPAHLLLALPSMLRSLADELDAKGPSA